MPVASLAQLFFDLVHPKVVQLFASTPLTTSPLVFISNLAFLFCYVIGWVLSLPQLSVSAIRRFFPSSVLCVRSGFKFCDNFPTFTSSCEQSRLLFKCVILGFPGGSFIIRTVGVFPSLPFLLWLLEAYVTLLRRCSAIALENLFCFCTPRVGVVGFHSEKSLVSVSQVPSSIDKPLSLSFWSSPIGLTNFERCSGTIRSVFNFVGAVNSVFWVGWLAVIFTWVHSRGQECANSTRRAQAFWSWAIWFSACCSMFTGSIIRSFVLIASYLFNFIPPAI